MNKITEKHIAFAKMHVAYKLGKHLDYDDCLSHVLCKMIRRVELYDGSTPFDGYVTHRVTYDCKDYIRNQMPLKRNGTPRANFFSMNALSDGDGTLFDLPDSNQHEPFRELECEEMRARIEELDEFGIVPHLASGSNLREASETMGVTESRMCQRRKQLQRLVKTEILKEDLK